VSVVAVVSEWCQCGVSVVSEWRYRVLSEWCQSVVLECFCSGARVVLESGNLVSEVVAEVLEWF
jgi:hypothetical protein